MRESLADYCIRFQRQDLLSQWDEPGNAPLTPATVSYGSRRKVWWQCDHGHRWQAAVYTRTGGESGCPYCAGKRPWPGFNDLASQYPDLAAQWHPPETGTSPRTKSCAAATAGCGGSAPRATSGAPSSSPGQKGPAAPTAPAGKSAPGSTTWPPASPTWPRSGTRRRTGASPPGTWCPAAGGRSGGSAPRATCGRLPSPPGRWMGRAARCAPESRWRQGENDLATLFPHLASSGTGRATGP